MGFREERRAVAIDPADPTGNSVYVGGAYGGLWKSSNAGPLSPNYSAVTWTPLIDDQATLVVGSIAIQPQLSNSDPAKSVILVGTGETNNSADSYYGLGILRYDGIGNWTLISQDISGTHSFGGLGFSKIAFSTANPNLVVAAASVAVEGVIEGYESPPNVNRGIYYSTNGGVSWTYAIMTDASNATDPSSVTSVVYDAFMCAHVIKPHTCIRWNGFYSHSQQHVAQSYTFNIVAHDSSGAQKLSAVTFNSTGSASFDFSIVNNSGGQTVLAGQSATYDLNVVPVPAQSPNIVTLSCSGVPQHSTCTVTPSQVTFGTGAVADVTLTIATAAPTA